MISRPAFFSTKILPLFALLLLAGCATAPVEEGAQTEKDKIPLEITPVSFADLPGWENDTQSETLIAFQRSCERIIKRDAATSFGPIGGTYGDWQPACRFALAMNGMNENEARGFFESWFTPYQASAAGDVKGLFTGYYEAMLHGSRTKHGKYQTPLYGVPSDLVMVELGEFRESLKGERIAGRVQGNKLKPYEDRATIEGKGIPAEKARVIAWVDDPVDAFFLHIQGSGIVEMDDGSILRVGYGGQNGHSYYAIGRELIKRGHMQKEEVSMQSIRAWLEKNPGEAVAFMNLNPSYIFFEEMKGEGPKGGEGVALTAHRSLAVDRAKVPYGIPVWLVADAPAAGEAPIARLLVAQDTGGAIRGAVRGDVFWGFGPRAEEMAGLMKSEGRYWFLLPKASN